MSRRRFKVGIEPGYDVRFDVRKRQSTVLNEKNFDINWDALTASSKGGLQSLLYELVGDGDEQNPGMIRGREGYPVPSKILHWKNKIAEIEEEFKIFRQGKVNQGMRAPDKMPPHLHEKHMEALAELDIKTEEYDRLKKKLDEFKAKEQQADDRKVLPRGPEGTRVLRGGLVAIADGQIVKLDKKGVLRIADERSPYLGMEMQDYHEKIVLPWKQECQRQKRHRLPNPPWPESIKQPTKKELAEMFK